MNSLLDRTARAGLDRPATLLLLAALVLAALHHADHVLRVDHSGWPFRPDVTPFTWSLLAYPVILFGLLGPRRLLRLRALLLAGAAGFTIYAHAAIESPHMQFQMWAENESLDVEGAHNMPGIRSPVLGALAVMVSMALNLVALAATLAVARCWWRSRRSA